MARDLVTGEGAAARDSRLHRSWLVIRRKVSGARAAAFLGYLALQALVVVGLPTIRTQISAEYLRLDFTGRQPRLWTVPLIYKLLPTDSLRIAGQVALASACWFVLASVASTMVRDRRVRIGLWVVVLALGVTGPVAEWNSSIGGESVTISLTALVVAAWLMFVRQPRAAAAVCAVLATTLWMFTRQDHVVMTALVAVVVAAGVALAGVRKKLRRALPVYVAIALVLVSALGFATASRNHSLADVNIAAIVARRVLPSDAYTQWFADRGMPVTPNMAALARGEIPEKLGSDPDFAKWVKAHGQRTYFDFLLSHPSYTLTRPLPFITGEEPSLFVEGDTDVFTPDPTPSFISPNANWARHREVLPRFLQDLLFTPGQSADVISLSVVAIGLAVVARRRAGADRRRLVPAIVLGTVVPHVYLVWLSSASELDRHALIIAVSLRIGLWLMAAYALDALLGASPAGEP